jgi:hypothetical protein
MSEAMNPMNQGRPMDQGDPVTPSNDVGTPFTSSARPVDQGSPIYEESPVNQGAVMSQRGAMALERPGLVTFAAIMMFVAGGFELVWALVEFANAAWLGSVTYGTFNGYLWLWAILDLVLAAAIFYAGYDILRGGSFGRIFGVIVACISAVRWFFYIPASPWLSIVAIAVDVLIIYALAAHEEFFNAASSMRS